MYHRPGIATLRDLKIFMMKNSEREREREREREIQENCRGEITRGNKPLKKIALRKNVPQENCPLPRKIVSLDFCCF